MPYFTYALLLTTSKIRPSAIESEQIVQTAKRAQAQT